MGTNQAELLVFIQPTSRCGSPHSFDSASIDPNSLSKRRRVTLLGNVFLIDIQFIIIHFKSQLLYKYPFICIFYEIMRKKELTHVAVG